MQCKLKKARHKQIYPLSIANAKMINESPRYVADRHERQSVYLLSTLHYALNAARRVAAPPPRGCTLLFGSPFPHVHPTSGIIFRRFTANDKDEWIIYAPLDTMAFRTRVIRK